MVCKIYVKLFLGNRKYIAPTSQGLCEEDSVIEVLPSWHCVCGGQGVPSQSRPKLAYAFGVVFKGDPARVACQQKVTDYLVSLLI